MSNYHFYKEINLLSFDNSKFTFQNGKIEELYSQGFKFTRKGVGNMQSTRLVRVNVADFDLSSENRRILRKFENLKIRSEKLPYGNYDYKIGKWMKDFYSSKFGEKLFDIQTIKTLFFGDLNFNSVLIYELEEEIVGFCLCYQTQSVLQNLSIPEKQKEIEILHYAYPFYKLDMINSSLGIAMMTKAVEFTKSQNLDYIYLGGHTNEKDNYKLQFKGLEWWDEQDGSWDKDLGKLKNEEILNKR